MVDKIIESTGWANLNDMQRAGALLTLVETETVRLGQVAGVIVGVHGNDNPQQEAALSAPPGATLPASARAYDSHLLILTYGKHSGTGVIAGTGSSATATVGDGVITVGGWGWIFGDEGGAAGIVRDAAKQALDLYDRGEADPFATAFLSYFAVVHPHSLEQVFATVEPRVWAKATRSLQLITDLAFAFGLGTASQARADTPDNQLVIATSLAHKDLAGKIHRRETCRVADV